MHRTILSIDIHIIPNKIYYKLINPNGEVTAGKIALREQIILHPQGVIMYM
ncbi:hypothetical protein KAX97_08520 [candidate division WOR-3 bacterium]|nr:hypothetical protein [candidate division WOR-3 bacterium]